MGVAVGQIDENIVENVVDFHDQSVFEFDNIDVLVERLGLLYLFDGLSIDGVNIEHDIFGGVLFGLFLCKLSFA